ncbi:sigma factor-like helix-turn-helix DNA-binding protein [Acinetobacter baumannii]
MTMRYGYELKMTEIADILGKDSATIRKQMERARKYLAEKLENVTEDIR